MELVFEIALVWPRLHYVIWVYNYVFLKNEGTFPVSFLETLEWTFLAFLIFPYFSFLCWPSRQLFSACKFVKQYDMIRHDTVD